FGAKNLQIKNVSMSNIGGRGEFPKTDAYGDGIYISVLKKDAEILIDNCIIQGALVSNRRSRSGITFEYSIHPYKATISNSRISQFAKSFHFEEEAASNIQIDNCNLSLFNYAIAMVSNKNSVLNVFNSQLICS